MAARTPPKKRSLYDILGVSRDAMAIDIGVAYKQRLAELNKTPDADPNELALVREAYHILCQPKEREAYDAKLLTREEREEAQTRPAPDLVLEADEEEKPKKPLGVWIGIGAVILGALVVFVMRPGSKPDARAPAVVAEEPKPAPPPPPPPPKPRSAQEVFAQSGPSTARILAYEISGKSVPVGSGIVVAPDAIVTTCHALPPSGTIVARLGAESLPATLAILDEDLNLCRLSVAGIKSAPLAAGPDEPKPGDTVHAIGQFKGAELSVVSGTVKQVRATPGGKVFEISMPVGPSASGGALFDTYGRLVGILTSRPGDSALPASAIAQMRTRGGTAPKQ